MITHIYVEDYLELLAGYEPRTNPNASIFPGTKRISLARYDVAVLESISAHTVFGGALTDRQAALCTKIVLKYRKQFAKLGIDVSPVETPVYRLPVRKLDRARRIWVHDSKIIVKFPYDRNRIEEVQDYKTASHGKVEWNNEEKFWKFGLTEANVNWAVTWGEMHNFDIDVTVQVLFDQIITCEKTPYEIKLVKTLAGFSITNAAPSLIEYITSYVGGFEMSNAVKLIDYSGILGYTYDEELVRPALLDIFKDRRIAHIVPKEGMLDLIFAYAELTNRYPICIYDPSMRGVDLSRFDERDIVRFGPNGKTKTCDYNIHNVKVVYANKIPKSWDYDIPLLVSTHELLYGGKRMEWLNKAGKVIYYCTTLIRETD